ncbi:hypothetical protein MtrunA17_Chr2g0328421 [Medicago truncatula]|uniref:Uncharacterized protein n=1 Tax=Medicago truncatula TaxID=3880 RepID=A0A396JIC1_MEDTR|nr:hypothetical protein MtrunA17_Chr2g0328421 [Medicago truncatula]
MEEDFWINLPDQLQHSFSWTIQCHSFIRKVLQSVQTANKSYFIPVYL